jgi:hypothetical protein
LCRNSSTGTDSKIWHTRDIGQHYGFAEDLFIVSDGVKKYGESSPIGDGDYFHIGSCSKSVLAYMAAKLIVGRFVKVGHQVLVLSIPNWIDGALPVLFGITLE